MPEPAVELCSPPTHDSALDAAVDGEGPLCYRRLADVYDTTKPVPAPQDTPEPGFDDDELKTLCLVTADEPVGVEEALASPEWKAAMQEEMKAIVDNNTWTAATLPSGCRAIGLKWVFKLKKDPDGNVVKHKARLVVKGYAQRQGVYFDEVFAPVARMETVRVLITLAAHAGWLVHHMDVKSAFLNGDLAEEVYVHQPDGFTDTDNPRAVLKLSKALYMGSVRRCVLGMPSLMHLSVNLGLCAVPWSMPCTGAATTPRTCSWGSTLMI